MGVPETIIGVDFGMIPSKSVESVICLTCRLVVEKTEKGFYCNKCEKEIIIGDGVND